MEERSPRLLSVDALRGLIMVLMALDHANFFVAQKHSSGEYWGGAMPVYHDGWAFITRLVTHLSAPGFFFLMGVGMFYFSRSRREGGWGNWAIIRFFLIRGSFLIILQFLVVNYAWKLGSGLFPKHYIGVLVALGGSMILASFLLQVKPYYWLISAGILFVGMELLHPQPDQWGLANIWGLIFMYSGGNLSLWSNYPVLPWLELVLLGMYFGYRLALDTQRTVKQAGLWGSLLLVAFLFLRYLNSFGNIRPIEGDRWIDFFNVVKYPPSITFTLLTMGANLIILSFLGWLETKTTWISEILAVYGREPLLFYLVHLFLYLGLGILVAPNGSTLAGMVPIWISGLAIMYPLCKIYHTIKVQHSSLSLLRYL